MTNAFEPTRDLSMDELDNVSAGWGWFRSASNTVKDSLKDTSDWVQDQTDKVI